MQYFSLFSDLSKVSEMKRKNTSIPMFAQNNFCSYMHSHVCHVSQENEKHDHNQGFVIPQVFYFLLLRNVTPRLHLIEKSGYLGLIMVASMSNVLLEGTTSKCRIMHKNSNKADFNVLLLFFIYFYEGFFSNLKVLLHVFIHTCFLEQKQGVPRTLST